ncbi:MAG TPA: hypothetical protein VKV24_05605 [Casimicrobiaceae bacterium]|nr:hypothetical protein [Casimicrobiaceae bacterium]
MLGPLHENAFGPVDLAITKLAVSPKHNREDTEALARARLLAADPFERRAKEALDYYVGRPAAPRANLREAVKIVRACSKTPKSSRGTRRRAS